MSAWQKKWRWFSRLGMAVKAWHSAQIALSFLVAGYAAFSAFSDGLPESQLMAFSVLAFGGTLLAINQLRILLGIPIEVKSRESFEYGLRYTGVDVVYDFRNIQGGLQIVVGLANS